MATVKFGSKKTTDRSTGEVERENAASVENGELQRESQVPAVQGDKTLALPAEEGAGFAGSWSRKDIRLPRINLIHKTSAGDMIEKFGIGSFALDKAVKLSDGKKPIIVTALRAAKDYQQKLPYGSDETPIVYDTPEEVIAAGGSLNYKDASTGNFYGPRAHIQLVFQLPEGATEEEAALFPYEFDGKPYSMALLTVASSAFTSVGKELATLCNNNRVMRKGMEYGRLELFSETRKKGDLDWKIPVIKYVGENPAELVEFYRSLL